MSMTFNTKTVHAKGLNGLFTGTGTAGQAGSSTVAYVPTLWTFNTGITPESGDVISIKVPNGGVNSGIWMSVDNGTTYYPVALFNSIRAQKELVLGTYATLIYETGQTTKIYGQTQAGAAAGASLSSYTGARWRVVSGSGFNVIHTYFTNNTSQNVLFTASEGGMSTNDSVGTTGKCSGFTYNPSINRLKNSGDIMSHDKLCLFGEYSASTAPSSPVTNQIWLKQASMSIEEAKVLVVSSTISSLPTTISHSSITSDMEVMKSEFGTPSSVTSDITYVTTTGSITLSGTLSGSTTIELWLMRTRS